MLSGTVLKNQKKKVKPSCYAITVSTTAHVAEDDTSTEKDKELISRI